MSDGPEVTRLAEAGVGWPDRVCEALIPLVLSETMPSLCTPKRRKRLELAAAAERLAAVLDEAGDALPEDEEGEGAGEPLGAVLDGAAGVAGAAHSPAEVHTRTRASDASKLVRKLGKAAAAGEDGERVRRLQQKASEAFRHLMARLSTAYAARVDSAMLSRGGAHAIRQEPQVAQADLVREVGDVVREGRHVDAHVQR